MKKHTYTVKYRTFGNLQIGRICKSVTTYTYVTVKIERRTKLILAAFRPKFYILVNFGRENLNWDYTPPLRTDRGQPKISDEYFFKKRDNLIQHSNIFKTAPIF